MHNFHVDNTRIDKGIVYDMIKAVRLKGIPYLEYSITREGIKPDYNKIQGIMDLGQLTTTTEMQIRIGMVHYYRDMWTRRSHVLAPLEEADRETRSR